MMAMPKSMIDREGVVIYAHTCRRHLRLSRFDSESVVLFVDAFCAWKKVAEQSIHRAGQLCFALLMPFDFPFCFFFFVKLIALRTFMHDAAKNTAKKLRLAQPAAKAKATAGRSQQLSRLATSAIPS